MTTRMWLKLLLQIALIPLKLPFLFLFRVWKPSWKMKASLFSSIDGPKRDCYKEKLDMDAYLLSGDGAKYAGLYYFAESTEAAWDIVKGFWRPTTFARYINPNQDASSDNFSGDMISGMLWAIWYRFRTIGLTKPEWENLKAIWENTVFNGNPFTFKHPTGKTNQDRGYLLSYMSFGNEVLTLVAFLLIGYRIFGDDRYRRIANRYFGLLFPLLSLPDVGFAYKKVYAAAWYDEHSEMLIYAAGYGASEGLTQRYFSKAAQFLQKRYEYNPEIQAIYTNVFDNTHYVGLQRMFLRDYNMTEVGTYKIPDDMLTKYFSIRSLISFENPIKVMSAFILPSRYRSDKYMWQEKDVDPKIDGKGGAFLDYLHLDALINKPYYPNDL